jgi:predicted regulator of Ras-like GTPase activity (Roadblock/LC7/MglB family)
MKLPAGTEGGVIIDPPKDGILQYLMEFKGAIEIDSGWGKGFILTLNGELIAAYFRDKQGEHRGASALRYLMAIPDNDTGLQQQNFVLRAYGDEDFADVLERCTRDRLLIDTALSGDTTVSAREKTSDLRRHTSPRLDESTLTRIIRQPGVVAVSAFYEGFPVLSAGEADFEQVAARAEDLLRAGTTIAQDMNLGQPDQLILETAENKFIIVPCGDLFLCVITRADAQLGLMRGLLRRIQTEVKSDA